MKIYVLELVGVEDNAWQIDVLGVESWQIEEWQIEAWQIEAWQIEEWQVGVRVGWCSWKDRKAS